MRLRTSSKRRLWVDSICIDQTSASEKTVQIPLMGDIYGQAKNVLVWLGEGTEASDKSFKYLKDMYEILKRLLSQGDWVSKMTVGQQFSIPMHIEQEVMIRNIAYEGMH